MQSPNISPSDEVKIRLGLKMRPRVAFVRQTLDLLDESERNIEQLMEEEVRKAEEFGSVNEMLDPDPVYALREEYRVGLPLNARYAALISAVAGLEWLVHSLHTAHRDDLSEFIRHEESQKSGDAAAARRLSETRKIVEQDRKIGRGRVGESLKRMAKRAKPGGEDDAGGMFSDLCATRNAVVHCGGAIAEFNDPPMLRAAISRLNGFHAAREVGADGETFVMPLSQGPQEEQIWIERDALRPLVGRALDFITKVHRANFDAPDLETLVRYHADNLG